MAVLPTGQVNSLVYIGDWDYMLQTKYMFSEPIALPVGTTLILNAVYDNTDQNPEQPNWPIKDVVFGQSGTEEMLILTLYHVQGKVVDGQNCTSSLLQ